MTAKLNKVAYLPLIFFALCLIFLIYSFSANTLKLDIDFTGGTQIVFESDTPFSDTAISELLSDYDASVRTGRGVSSNTLVVTVDESVKSEDIINSLKDANYSFDDYSVQTVGSSLGSGFFQQASLALIIAFILMAVVIFIIFRIPIISVYTALCPLFDIVETLVITQFLGIELSLAGFAALLMIVGYSVNDDVLLATRILKSDHSKMEQNIKGSFKTSITATSATLVALLCLFILSISDVFTQIATFLIIGLFVDMFNTWIFNVNVLRLYVAKKGETDVKTA